jgi:hypothetical protein
MSKHTPGPWEIYPDGNRKHILRAGSMEFISPSYTKADWIAELDPDGTGHDEDETEANARLIAASPALLAECLATVTMLRASSIADHPWAAERIAALAAAIDLATKGGA